MESLHSAGGIDQLLFAGKERMAFRTDFEMDLRFGGSGLKRLAASALHNGFDVLGMDIRFHYASSETSNYMVKRAFRPVPISFDETRSLAYSNGTPLSRCC